MLIKTEFTATQKIVHQDKEYPVVNGYADVPQDVANYLTGFSEWTLVTDPLDKKVQAALEKAKPTDQNDTPSTTDQGGGGSGNPDGNPPTGV